MPNYSIVIDTSQFKPYDYSLSYNVLKDYNTGYEKQLAIYDKIALSLGDLDSAVLGTEKAKLIYDNYQNRFNKAVEDFSRGMTTKNASDLVALRRLYGADIRKLERANEALVKEAERRRADKPEANMLYQDIGTLDDYLEDPNRVLGSYSGTLLTNEVSALVGAVAKSMVERDNNGRLDPYNKVWLETSGFSRENINKAVEEVLKGGINYVSDHILRNILNLAMQASGIANWADETTYKKAENLAARGLYGGIGESKTGIYEDYGERAYLNYYYNELAALNASRRKLFEEQYKKYLDGLNDNDNYLLEGIKALTDLEERPDGKTQYEAIAGTLDAVFNPENGYFGSKDGNEINPLEIYALRGLYAVLPKYKKKIKNEYYNIYGNAPSSEYYTVPDYDKIDEEIRKQYGVKNILTGELYAQLTDSSFGYDRYNFGKDKELEAYDKLNNFAIEHSAGYYIQGPKATTAALNSLLLSGVHGTLIKENGKIKNSTYDIGEIVPEDVERIGVRLSVNKSYIFIDLKNHQRVEINPLRIPEFKEYWLNQLTAMNNLENSTTLSKEKKNEKKQQLEQAATQFIKKSLINDMSLVTNESTSKNAD